jgi:redox-sensitive bicupin YhaK (pirin superfamily)
MIEIRSSGDRGLSRTGWLESRHSFSFASYHDADHMGFRSLRVLNEDWIAPARGFGPHPHRDMEILTYPIAGELEHRDDQGSRSRLSPGRFQLMTAGTGVVHSETNASATETLHLYQIWITPDRPGHSPLYQERDVDLDAGPFQALATPDGRDDTLRIHQDANLYRVHLDALSEYPHRLRPGRHAWLQLVRGEMTLNGTKLLAGDGAAIAGETLLQLCAQTDTEALFFDLA